MTPARPRSEARPATRGRDIRPARTSLGRRMGRAVLRFAGQRPGVVVATLIVVGSGAVVSWNAFHQSNRHPSPLFGQRQAGLQPEPPRRPEIAAPVPAKRPDLGQAAPAPAIPAVPPETPARPAAADPIGAIIRSADAPARPAPEPQRVSSAQKALSKLGYGPLKADGVMGVTTRQALERFERDQNLPVTGAIAGRTSRQLAVRSGNPID